MTRPLCLCLGTLVLSACGGTTVRMYIVDDSSSVYEALPDRPDVLRMISNRGEQVTYTDETSSRYATMSRAPVWRVAGTDYEGHASLRLRAGPDGKFYAEFDSLCMDTIEGVPVRLKSVFSAELKFTRGDWSAFQEGKPVEMEFTPEGQECVDREAARALQEALQQALRGQAGAFFACDVESCSTEGTGRLSGDRNRLESRSPPTRFTLLLRVPGR